MKRFAILFYGSFVYLVFLGTFTYALGFVMNFMVPRGIDDGVVRGLWGSVLINIGLLSLFAIQHTIMARPAFKRWLARHLPVPMERSTFVLAASLILVLLFIAWRPIPETVWSVEQPTLRVTLHTLSLMGFGLVLYSSFLIDHFELFGLKQAVYAWLGKSMPVNQFVERSLYRFVRHPLMLGFLIGFWAAPTMSLGRLLFCVVITAYVFVGTTIEEHDLDSQLGGVYYEYQRRTPRLFPRFMPRPEYTPAIAPSGKQV